KQNSSERPTNEAHQGTLSLQDRSPLTVLMSRLSVDVRLLFFAGSLIVGRRLRFRWRNREVCLFGDIEDATRCNRVALSHFLKRHLQSHGLDNVSALFKLAGKMFSQSLFIAAQMTGDAGNRPVGSFQKR